METGRVALIRYRAPDGRPCVGSGLLIDERRVLTAGHVADGSGHRVECDSGGSDVAEVLRSGAPEVDLAVLTLRGAVAGLTRLECARVGRGRVDRVSGCTAVGFPRWRKDGDMRRSAQVDGSVPTAEGLESTADARLRAEWLTLVGERIPGAPNIPAGMLTDAAPSPWGGMSGAVVVAGDLVIGVVRSHNLAAGGQSLTVTPVTAIDQLPAAVRQRFWDALGVPDPSRLPVLPGATAAGRPRITEFRGRGHLLTFAGRDDELTALHGLLTGGQAAPVVLHGLGGAGKSQLAVEYAYARLDELPVAWTVRADGVSVLASDLAALGVATGAADAAEADIDVQLTATRSWLASHPGWLLIIDNVDDPSVQQAVHQILPGNLLGRVIITGRISSWPGRYHPLEITPLGTSPAAGLLLKITADADEHSARALADDLGGLPLALQQAGSYCQQNGKTLASYLALFRDTRKQARLLASGQDGNETVATTWMVSVQQVHDSNPAAAALLDILAYLAPDAIPRSLLAEAGQDGNAEAGGPGSAQIPAAALPAESPDDPAADLLALLRDLDELAVDEALGVLHRYSLIRLTPQAIMVHRLVQAVIRASHNPRIREASAAAAATLVRGALPELGHEAWPAYEILLPHALAAGAHASASATSAGHQVLGIDLLDLAGTYQRERGLYTGARQTHQQVLAATEKAFAGDHQRMIDALGGLVVTLTEAGDPAAARPYASRALKIAEAEFGADHAQTLGPANNLGGVLVQLGKPADARPYLEQALRIAEAEFGADHAQTLFPANNLGNVLFQLGKPADARPYLEHALRIAERTYGPEDPRIAGYLHRLADVARQLEPGTAAVSLLERAVAINEETHGRASPEVVGDLRCLAAALVEAGRESDAVILLRRVLTVDEENVGQLAEPLLPTLTSLADALLASADPAGALRYLKRIVAVTEHTWGSNDLRLVGPMRKLANCMMACNAESEVIPVLERLAALHDHYGAETADVVHDLRLLTAALVQQGRSGDAHYYLEWARDIEHRVSKSSKLS